LNDVVEHFTNRLRELGEEKIDREWFTSEEFQTLLFDALRQLQVTHDSAKLKMLGVGLANSGADRFKEEERKDLFIRFVRVSRLSWKWRERSSVKIAERTYEERA